MQLRSICDAGRLFSAYFLLALAVSTHQCSILIFIYLLLLADKQEKSEHLQQRNALSVIRKHQKDNCHVPASGRCSVVFLALRVDAELSWYQKSTEGFSCCPPKINFKFYDQTQPSQRYKNVVSSKHKTQPSAAYCNSALFITEPSSPPTPPPNSKPTLTRTTTHYLGTFRALNFLFFSSIITTPSSFFSIFPLLIL